MIAIVTILAKTEVARDSQTIVMRMVNAAIALLVMMVYALIQSSSQSNSTVSPSSASLNTVFGTETTTLSIVKV